jgi:hypothetical protein
VNLASGATGTGSAAIPIISVKPPAWARRLRPPPLVVQWATSSRAAVTRRDRVRAARPRFVDGPETLPRPGRRPRARRLRSLLDACGPWSPGASHGPPPVPSHYLRSSDTRGGSRRLPGWRQSLPSALAPGSPTSCDPRQSGQPPRTGSRPERAATPSVGAPDCPPRGRAVPRQARPGHGAWLEGRAGERPAPRGGRSPPGSQGELPSPAGRAAD